MTPDELTALFREHLRECCRKEKYRGKFNTEDEHRAVQTFRLALENANLSDTLLLEQLTGEKQV
jgi:hypothetical protein